MPVKETVKPQFAAIQRAETFAAGTKCYPLFIGGKALKDGLTQSSMEPRSCDVLRCRDCDKRVIRYSNDCKWGEQVDYIFVRNYNTLPEKLQEGLVSAKGYAAYACQCKFVSLEDDFVKVEDLPNFNWHCRGHKPE